MATEWTQEAVDNLFWALHDYRLDVREAKVLGALASGFPVNARKSWYPQCTLLGDLAWMSKTEVLVQAVVDAGADALIPDCYGQTPAHIAANIGMLGVLKILQAKCPGAMSALDAKGNNLLYHHILIRPEQEIILWLLQQPDLPLLAKNKRGQTALDECRQRSWLHKRFSDVIECEMQCRARWSGSRAAWLAAVTLYD
jgi:hypothetical protein